MNLNKYETIYILQPNITESENLILINEYKALIKKYGGNNIVVQHKGRRHLNYNIKSYYDGIYVQINYTASSNLVRILEKAMRLSQHVIRYMTIKNCHMNDIKI
uniref:Small ribosomal subunit protein bS6c n=1 Tax=Gracilaria tenuistipitata var. liui TaxID=285951 RepID=RR6_GRATL|nr:ribosomal protein S6 [Gracilaria tenuistipitata var. liui]Q6B922.1 RecName: Full=Small ribosomal subunit protein bS6c; AltName: Full=30S ribosomal protein S6, chloroplastic [Gracilaria tenuistipitata var. liui]AAT79613.1 30S ribosomal protein S6 [Gracilaria tenuistipitata var. liui]